MTQLLVTLALIVGSLTAGYAYRVAVLRRSPDRAAELRRLATRLQRLVVTTLTPIILVNTFWPLRLSGGTLVLFPFIGGLSHLIGGSLGVAASRALGHGRPQAGAMFTCAAFTNLTMFGGLVAFIFYGEAGFALNALFKLLEPVVYYAIGFPLAKLYSAETPPGTKWRFDLKALGRDPVIMLPLSSIVVGTLLNWSGLARPALFGALLSPLVMVSTALMLLSVGINMRPAAVGRYRREALAVSGIKFLVLPAVLTLIGLAVGYHRLDGGLPFKVLLAMSAMPVAFNALIPPSLYGLDTDLANSCWLVTTGLFVVVVLPLLYLVSLI